MNALEAQRKLLLSKLLTGVVSDDAYKERDTSLKAQLEDVSKQQCYTSDEEDESQVELMVALDHSLTILNNAWILWEEGRLEVRRRIQTALFPSGVEVVGKTLRTASTTFFSVV